MRIQHFIIVALVTTCVIVGIFFIDAVFSNKMSKKTHRFDNEFTIIDRHLDEKSYKEVIKLGNRISNKSELGINQIHSLSAVCISYFELGRLNEFESTFKYLYETYPIFRLSENGKYPDNEEKKIIVDLIFKDYLNNQKTEYDNNTTFLDILSHFSIGHWIQLLFWNLIAIGIYEKVRRRKKHNRIVR